MNNSSSSSPPAIFLRPQSSASRARQDFMENAELFDSPPPPLDEIPITVGKTTMATTVELPIDAEPKQQDGRPLS